MKKFLALMIAVVMAFSMVAMPVSAADVTADLEKVETTVNDAFDYIENLMESIHKLVGDILAVFDKECPFCGEIHGDDKDCTCEGECTCDKDDEQPVKTYDDAPYVVAKGAFATDADIALPARALIKDKSAIVVVDAVINSLILDGIYGLYIGDAIVINKDAACKVIIKDAYASQYVLTEGGKLIVNNSGAAIDVEIEKGIIVNSDGVNTVITSAEIAKQFIEGDCNITIK